MHSNFRPLTSRSLWPWRSIAQSLTPRRRLALACAVAVIGLSVLRIQGQQVCPCSIWTLSTTPGPVANDSSAVELGVKFTADNASSITGLRFYKYAQNTGAHVGNLWTAAGTLLGTVTFAGETASGWQQANFGSPVAIAANTTYVASYHTAAGFYAATNSGLTAGVDNAPLHALSDAVGGGNGVYRYGASAFPNQTYQASNYWVDVVLAPSGPIVPTVTATTPSSGATGVSAATTVTATFNEPLNAATVTTATVLLKTATNSLVAATVTYSSSIATLTPSAPLAASSTYTATVKGGASGVKDLAGNAMVADVTWSFTTGAPTTCPCSIWTLSTTPGPVANDPSSVEVGVKFTADSNGLLTGLRFYKYAQNTGAHVGNLWTAAGTLLGQVTFTGETASGWQQASFASPVAITASTTYVASYHTATGFYAATSSGLTAAVDNVPLHALSNAVGGGNGVYGYGPSGFPSQTYQATNYWVDVVFAPSGPTPPAVTATTPASGATGVSTGTAVTATFNEPLNAATVTTATVLLKTATNSLVPATVTYGGGIATLTPSAPLAASSTYTATVMGGASGVKDPAGDPMAANVTWSFTTAAVGACCSIWTLSTTPGPLANDPSAVELGLKFTADSNGFITGLRFYKYAQNTVGSSRVDLQACKLEYSIVSPK